MFHMSDAKHNILEKFSPDLEFVNPLYKQPDMTLIFEQKWDFNSAKLCSRAILIKGKIDFNELYKTV